MSTPFNHKKVDEFKNLLQEFDEIVIDFAKLQKLNSNEAKEKEIKSAGKKTREFLSTLNLWWGKNFQDTSDGLILFGKQYANNKSISFKEHYKIESSNLLDLIHSHIIERNESLGVIKNKLISERNKSSKLISDLESLEADYEEIESKFEEFENIVIRELLHSNLTNDVKGIILGNETEFKQYWDDPRSHLPFSINSGMNAVKSSTYSSGRFQHPFSIDSQLLPFSDVIIGCDLKSNYNSADSCRVFYSREHVNITICDGATQGGINSALYSHILSDFASSCIPMSRNGMIFYKSHHLNNQFKKVFQNDSLSGGYHTRLRKLGYEKSNQVLDNKRGALSTITQVIIQKSGAYQTLRFGDCCVFKLTTDGVLSHVNVDPNLKQGATDLVGPMVPSGALDGKIVIEHGHLSSGEILFGCTDKLAELIVDYPEESAKLISEIYENPSDLDKFKKLFETVAKKIAGEDDLTFFIYKHLGQNPNEKFIECEKNDSSGIVIEGVRYNNSGSDRYFLSEDGKSGIQRISKTRYDNLNHFSPKKQNFEYFVDYETMYSEDESGNKSYFLSMPHLGGNYQSLGSILDEITRPVEGEGIVANADEIIGKAKDDLSLILRLFEEFNSALEEENITHLDIDTSNVFMDLKGQKLVCIDPESFYSEGCFTLDLVGHTGMYGRTHGHITCTKTHRMAVKLIQFSLELIISDVNNQNAWGNFNNTDGVILFSPEEVETMFLKNPKSEEYQELKIKIQNDFNMESDKINKWLSELRYSKIYNFD